jgi:hypothetical protein
MLDNARDGATYKTRQSSPAGLIIRQKEPTNLDRLAKSRVALGDPAKFRQRIRR